MRYFLVLLLLCSPIYAQQMSGSLNGTTPESRAAYIKQYCKTHRSAQCRQAKVVPKPKPEVIEECVKSDVYIKAYADRFHLNVDRKLEFVGDSLIKLRNKMKELSEKIDNLPDNIDRVLIFRRSNQSSIILTFVKECGESIAIVPTDLIVSLLEDDSI